tara:strand:- start:171600 stop:175211 length:3612 start_codon:yes stop_codon:yes gene_type:complete
MRIRGQHLFLVIFLLCFSATASADLFSSKSSSSSKPSEARPAVSESSNNDNSAISSDFTTDPTVVISDATESLSFAPPASDISVVFLGNLFGLVDGVLHGSGSQIMGVIFNVFNSAVLAMGGVVMMYIIIVSTMNTAHEGQMLGQKWSSIWVPVRATMGLALLIPKSSGYCLMQIFVMWVVVQGVGIADKVWGTALDYLNRGGVIMQAQIDTTISKRAGIDGVNTDNSVIDGASRILYGQVCMQALQTQLENQRKLNLDAKKEDSGPCAGQPSERMKQFCDNSVPDFIGSVDPLAEYSKNPGETYVLSMPNFDTEPYSKLNGVCGTIQWSAFDVSALTGAQSSSGSSIDSSDDGSVDKIRRKQGWGLGGSSIFGDKFKNKLQKLQKANSIQNEEEDGSSEQAALIGRAMQSSKAQLDAAGPLEARATTPGTPVGKEYAFLDKATKAVTKTTNQATSAVEKTTNETVNSVEKTTNETVNTVKDGAVDTYGQVKEGTEGVIQDIKDLFKTGGGGGGGGSGAGDGGGGGGVVGYGSGGGTAGNSFDSGNTITLSQADLDIIKKSRAAAISQMYTTLASTARTIVSNDPEINSNSGNPSDYASPVADYQFGVPQTSLNGECRNTDADCPYWGKIKGDSSPLLLDGTELQDAVTDYNAVMQPALKLLGDVKDKSKAESGRAFIQESKRSGWILAGSYFFHLVRLNGSSTATSNNVDSNSGLGHSTFSLDGINGICTSGHSYNLICHYFGGTEDKTKQIMALFQGPAGVDISAPNLSSRDLDRIPNDETSVSPAAASTVYGYANNSMLIDLPGQVGLKADGLGITFPKFNFKIKLDKISKPSNDCGSGSFKMPITNSRICPERIGKDVLWNVMQVGGNLFIDKLNDVGNYALNNILILPLEHFSTIFTESLKIITEPGTNPVLALAVMGVKYINMSMDTWMGIVLVILSVGLIPLVGPGIGALVMAVMPLFMVWIGIMVGIGFTTAYYIPFLPYMIFTFGALAWFISVVEAMAAAPLVALGISHPEGHDALGKSEQGLMILLNVFLRPAMMVIGFIASIAMCYVGVWLLNSGFSTVIDYLRTADVWGATESWSATSTALPWANIFGGFFVVIMYTMIYLTLVEKSFSLIAVLPDKVLRWVGGQAEGVGQEASQWTSEAKQQVGKAADATDKASGAIQKGAAGLAVDVGKGFQKKLFGGKDDADISGKGG